jgi:signal transduction histidine kinase/ActR/RegA family two-component response regulator
MNELGHDDAGGESISRAFYDIAQLLESAENSEARVVRVLERLRSLVPYDRCAVLEASSEHEERLITAADMPPAEREALAATIVGLLGRFLALPAQVGEEPTSSRAHLAVPLIGLDEVLGVLYVHSADATYDEAHVRALSVVAAKLAAYFSLLYALARVTERTELLAEARNAAQSADRAKDEFLALVSHELRTPLDSILGWTDALRSNTVSDADRARAAAAIERSVRKQTRLVADLLDLSCVAAATLRLDLRAVEPAELIRAAVRALQQQVRQKSISLDVVLDESVAPLIADPRRLSQIVVSLVANAIKFSSPGGQVEIRLDRVGVLARIRVTDSGSGMSPAVLSRLFEPFRQPDGSSALAHGGGMGIRLALVKDLVELHGGRVRAESSHERAGATFTVELPLAEPARGASVGSDTTAGTGALDGVRVLVVDDDEDIGEVLQIVLEDQGAIVTVVHSAAEALAALTLAMPDVLLSDIAMPGASGYDLMRAIVAREGARAPRAAALSAYAPAQDLHEALASGFTMLLEKPIDPQALVSAVAVLAKPAIEKEAS